MTSRWVCLLPAPFGTQGPTNSSNQKSRGRQKTWLSLLFSKNVSAAPPLVWHHKANIAACTFHLAQTANAHLLRVMFTICGPLDVTHVFKGLWFSPRFSKLSLSDRLERQPGRTHRKRAVKKSAWCCWWERIIFYLMRVNAEPQLRDTYWMCTAATLYWSEWSTFQHAQRWE